MIDNLTVHLHCYESANVTDCCRKSPAHRGQTVACGGSKALTNSTPGRHVASLVDALYYIQQQPHVLKGERDLFSVPSASICSAGRPAGCCCKVTPAAAATARRPATFNNTTTELLCVMTVSDLFHTHYFTQGAIATWKGKRRKDQGNQHCTSRN